MFSPRALALTLIFTFGITAAAAQKVVGQTGGGTQPTQFKDTSMLKPPAGQKVAMIVWEDLECPACSRSFPIEHEAANHYHIPIVRYDFPLKMHQWSRDAAIIARYIQDTISPSGAEEYRREVFAKQYQIASKDDLMAFTRKFFSDNKQPYPFVLDPNKRFEKEVDADLALGEKANLNHTPTIVVVNRNHYWEVLDVAQLYSAIDAAIADAPPAGATATAAKKTVPVRKTTHK